MSRILFSGSLRGRGEPQVVVHIGTNDIVRNRDGNARQVFRELWWKLRPRTNRVVISGLLPVPRTRRCQIGRESS